MKPTLQVTDLRTHIYLRSHVLKPVDGVSFNIAPGRILGLVGESGSGKSTVGYSVMRMIDPPGRVAGGSVEFNGTNILDLDDAEMRRLRGNRIAMVFQDPMMTLNPVLTIGTQMMETIAAHETIGKMQARDRCVHALELVGIPAPAERLKAYPHQMSGGMRQRVSIAIALLHEPGLIIADEPTTALDVTVQAQILSEVQKLAQDRGTAFLWITHDLSVVSGLADDVAVMYAGKIVEQGRTIDVLRNPQHPYTRGLIGSIPSGTAQGEMLTPIPGSAPNLTRLPQGCAFEPRCPHRLPQCASAVPPQSAGTGRALACFNPLVDAR
ncbi:ABC transporter ATP-binding protein [Aquamicrobium terrae]|uniref:Peptide/nickel transport system ATP-binding protein n=1 Tax=Aquamicrobium terrae TaxID=1324945 RepID=A0ABV2N113_9HYPH